MGRGTTKALTSWLTQQGRQKTDELNDAIISELNAAAEAKRLAELERKRKEEEARRLAEREWVDPAMALSRMESAWNPGGVYRMEVERYEDGLRGLISEYGRWERKVRVEEPLIQADLNTRDAYEKARQRWLSRVSEIAE